MKIENHEFYELSGTKIFISKEHRFGTDSLLLGDFLGKNYNNKVVCDLCSGCGIIPILILQRCKPKLVYSVEVQQEAVNLFRFTLENNKNFEKISDTEIKIILGDLRESETLAEIGRESVDLVTANPPYFAENSGFERISSSQKTARYETANFDENTKQNKKIGCTLEDVIFAANFLLKFGGELKMCMTAARLAECIAVMRQSSIEPKEIVLIPSKKTNKARLFLINGKKGGKSGVNLYWK